MSHLCRVLLQAIRDIRQSGAISTGNQEYMKQIGINPPRLRNELLDYVKCEGNNYDMVVTNLDEYVEELAARLAPLSIASLMPSADRGQR